MFGGATGHRWASFVRLNARLIASPIRRKRFGEASSDVSLRFIVQLIQ